MRQDNSRRANKKPRSRAAGAALAVVLAFAAACEPESRTGAPQRTGEGRVAAVPDAGSLVLDTGLEIRLAGLEPPRPAEGRASAEPGHRPAKQRLYDLAFAAPVRLAFVGEAAARDRWGRASAQAYSVHDGRETWLQGDLVGEGLVRVRAEAEAGERLADLLRLEAEARRDQRGIWAEPYYAVRSPETVSSAIGSFQIVEGVVVDAAEVKGWIYLNFGADWRTDFTAAVPPEHRDAVDADALLALPGARVRVRGQVGQRNGPMILIEHAGQVERFD